VGLFDGAAGGLKESRSFLKKEPKNFCFYGVRGAETLTPMRKSFCFFFQKEALSCSNSAVTV
jgi:hypothetical protein